MLQLSLVRTSDISISKITTKNYPLRFTKAKQKEFCFEFAFVLAQLMLVVSCSYVDAYVARFSGLVLFCLLFYLVLMLMSPVRTKL